ncbi:MAG TPA: hypothetical protein VE995_07830 [Gaiellaceae bacterium]|nr:hypothetical protein [Gaiellaceae bacterium]
MPAPPRFAASTTLLVLAGAFAAGVLLARCIAWLGNGSPHR